MTTLREAAQMALDALEHLQTDIEWQYKSPTRAMLRKVEKALRAALAQPEQEIESDRPHVEDDGCPTEKAVLQRFWREHQAQPEQEPVAWTEREIELIDGMIEVQIIHAERCDSIPNRAMAEKQKAWDMERIELLRKIRNTATPQREWVGLTDEDYEAMAEKYVTNCYFDTLKYARAIEARLREKNS